MKTFSTLSVTQVELGQDGSHNKKVEVKVLDGRRLIYVVYSHKV